MENLRATASVTPWISKANGVSGRPKALPYGLRVTVRKLVELYIKVPIIF